jgi:hypothetical protein
MRFSFVTGKRGKSRKPHAARLVWFIDAVTVLNIQSAAGGPGVRTYEAWRSNGVAWARNFARICGLGNSVELLHSVEIQLESRP